MQMVKKRLIGGKVLHSKELTFFHSPKGLLDKGELYKLQSMEVYEEVHKKLFKSNSQMALILTSDFK